MFKAQTVTRTTRVRMPMHLQCLCFVHAARIACVKISYVPFSPKILPWGAMVWPNWRQVQFTRLNGSLWLCSVHSEDRDCILCKFMKSNIKRIEKKCEQLSLQRDCTKFILMPLNKSSVGLLFCSNCAKTDDKQSLRVKYWAGESTWILYSYCRNSILCMQHMVRCNAVVICYHPGPDWVVAWIQSYYHLIHPHLLIYSKIYYLWGDVCGRLNKQSNHRMKLTKIDIFSLRWFFLLSATDINFLLPLHNCTVFAV